MIFKTKGTSDTGEIFKCSIKGTNQIWEHAKSNTKSGATTCVSPRVPLVEVLMITNQGYLSIMVNIELNDRFKFIKHQMKIIKLKMTMMKFIKHLEMKFTQIKEPR